MDQKFCTTIVSADPRKSLRPRESHPGVIPDYPGLKLLIELTGTGWPRNSYIATLVERRSRYVCLVRVTGKETHTVVRALTRRVQRLPAGLMATLTWDRGLELAARPIAPSRSRRGVQVYFCDPRSPWQRGTNENTNGLLRQYFPKRTDLSVYSQKYLDAIARRLNTRPRKTLGYRTPAVTLAETVALTD